MTRRRLLLLIGGGVAVVALKFPSRGLWGGGPAAPTGQLLAAIGPRNSAARGAATRVGAAARRVLPPESDPDNLAWEIASAVPANAPSLTELPADALRRSLEVGIRAEHLSGQTIAVEGWELSLTEARLYALAHLAGR